MATRTIWKELYQDLPENIAKVLREKRVKPEQLTAKTDGELLALGLSDADLEKVHVTYSPVIARQSASGGSESVAIHPVIPSAVEESSEKAKPVSTSHFAKYPSHIYGRSKRYKVLAKKIKSSETLAPKVALEKLIALATGSRTIDLHLNVTDTGLRGEVKTPFSTGKNVRVEIFSDKTVTALNNNEFNFDILLATPADMPKLARYAKILGPKGLMPNPKSGTVTADPEGRAKQLSAGATITYKTEPKFPIIHVTLGKTSQNVDELTGNLTTLLKEIGLTKITTAYINANQTPSVKLDLSSL
jgi:large subunit ribosomal protein L1